MTTITDIEKKTRAYADARATVAAIVTELEDAIDDLKADALPDLRRRLARAGALHDELQALIEDAPELFEKPKSHVFHGIKVGYAKAKGSLTWDDEDQVVARIKKQLPDQVDVLLAKKETPVKTALAQLPAATLKKLGVEVQADGDAVVIKPQDSDIEKLAKGLLGKEAT